MYNRRFKSILLAGLAGGAVLAGGSAHAATGTLAGTSITNTASVTYTVGGTTTTAPSASATFVVDKKVNLSVTQMGSVATQSALGATDQVTTFTVTNLTNATQDFQLAGDQPAITPTNYGIDNFNMNNVRVFVDSGNGVYDASDTQTFIHALAPDASATVFIVADTPNTAGESVAYVSLLGTVADVGNGSAPGSAVTATSTLTADSPGTVDVVFADGASLGDAARNGQARAFDAYVISTAAVSLAKTAAVVSDPVDLAVNPKAIPGAIIRYCMIVSNAGPGAATGVTVTDAIPANVTYNPGSIVVGGAGIGGICGLGGTPEDDDAVGADESDPNGGSFDGTTVRATMPTVLPNVPLGVIFTGTVN